MNNETTGLPLGEYAQEIKLFDDFLPGRLGSENAESIVDLLLSEIFDAADPDRDYPDKRRLLHAGLNTLAPNSLNEDSVARLDRLLQMELRAKTVTDSGALSRGSEVEVSNTGLAVWKGDITTLRVDAIVNAANNQLLGCFQPLHACIDNAIHSAAGVQLRDDCHIIMEKQGELEATGSAKITRGYNLPSRFVVHTVGPIVSGRLSTRNEKDLAKAYTSCLSLCGQIDSIRSIAFCGISTGVFGYPADRAAKTAVQTVISTLRGGDIDLDLVVFNVFSDSDRKIYEGLIKGL